MRPTVADIRAELEVVPDRVGAEITRRTPPMMLGMGAGPNADAQYPFAEDVLGCTRGHKPRHARHANVKTSARLSACKGARKRT